MKPILKAALCGALLVLGVRQAPAEKQYGPGVTDTEIKIGQTMPYSGPASSYGAYGKSEAAYFDKINAEGGINGRKIRLISLDDGYSPPRTVEQTRRLVEQEGVLLLFGSLGTATNSAVHKYLNARQVPQLFVASADGKFNDPEHFHWTMGFVPTQKTETAAYARYLLKNRPRARIAVLFQNDDFGKDYLKWFKAALGERASSMIVAEVSYETTDPVVDSQIFSLKASGADTLVDLATPKFAAQAIRRVYDIGWHPLHILAGASRSVAAVLQPAGLEKSVGLITGAFIKDPADPTWKDDASMQAWRAWMDRYYPDGDRADYSNIAGYAFAQALVYVLKMCGDDLTRQNVMRQAASIRNLELPVLLPGIRISTSPSDYRPIRQMQLQRFDGKSWALFGDVIGE